MCTVMHIMRLRLHLPFHLISDLHSLSFNVEICNLQIIHWKNRKTLISDLFNSTGKGLSAEVNQYRIPIQQTSIQSLLVHLFD